MNGFRSELIDKIVGINGHIIVYLNSKSANKNILIPEVLQRYLYILQSYNNNLIVYVTSERINEFKNRDITTTTENDTSLIDIIYYLDHITNNPDTNDKKEFAISNIKYLLRKGAKVKLFFPLREEQSNANIYFVMPIMGHIN